MKEGIVRIRTFYLLCTVILAGALGSFVQAAKPPRSPSPPSALSWVVLRGESFDLAEAALRLAPEAANRRDRRETLRRIDELAGRVTTALPPGATPRQTLDVINDVLFTKEGFRGTISLSDPSSPSIPQLLRDKRGTCVNLVILYLAIAERLGLDVHAAATPVHLFVRYDGPDGVINIETLEQGRTVDDAEYRRRNRIADSSVERGLFLGPLSQRAVIAHFLSNRGAIASRGGRREDALADFDAALELYPDLEAAYYNRGLEQLKAGQFEAARADLTKAVELHPLDAQAFNNRGLAELKIGDAAAARRDFEEAMRIEPGQKEARENLKLLGQPAAAAPAP